MNAAKPANTTTYYMSGSMFVAPGQQTWDLVDLKINGGVWNADTISFLQDTKALIDSNKVFYYISYDEADGDPDYIGWWYKSGEHMEEKVVSYPVPSGTAFMCEFFNEGTTITYAGEVIKGTEGKIEVSRANGQVFRFVANPTPVPVDLTDIEIVGGIWNADTYSFLQETKSLVNNDKVFYYISYDEADGDSDYIGWWYKSGEHMEEKVVKDEIYLQPGEGLMAEMYNDGSKIVFPAPKL